VTLERIKTTKIIRKLKCQHFLAPGRHPQGFTVTKILQVPTQQFGITSTKV